jgi:hypothetical protein
MLIAAGSLTCLDATAKLGRGDTSAMNAANRAGPRYAPASSLSWNDRETVLIRISLMS